MPMTDVVNLSIYMFIMVLYVNESFFIMLVYQDGYVRKLLVTVSQT